jgi:hypothetical protein
VAENFFFVRSRWGLWIGNVLVALFIDRVWVCDSQETCVDVERNVLLDEGRFSAVDIA